MEVPRVKPVKHLFYPTQILRELAWDLILLSAASSLQLSARNGD